MIKASVTVEDNDLGMDALIREIHNDASHVDIGVHADEENTLIIIAGANEFGATINHPGGTAYGYRTPEDAKKHRIRFLKGGTGYRVIGKTKPHTIIIPARSYIRSTMDEQSERFLKGADGLIGMVIDGDISKYQALERMGLLIETEIKKKIRTLRNPPNAPATIKAKGGKDNPLINKGTLVGSIRYVVKTATDRVLGGD